MTAHEMNVRSPKKTGAGAAAAMGLILAGCASIDPAQDATPGLVVDSARVEALVRANRTYPRWIDFPAAPTAAPEPAVIAAEVDTLRTGGLHLQSQVAALTWDMAEPESFARSIRARLDAEAASAPSVQTVAEIEAFAQRLRERATAPPPLD